MNQQETVYVSMVGVEMGWRKEWGQRTETAEGEAAAPTLVVGWVKRVPLVDERMYFSKVEAMVMEPYILC